MKRYVIGIDPGIHTGVAIWDREQKTIVSTDTSAFWDVFDRLIGAYAIMRHDHSVIIEVPNSRRPMYDRLENVKESRKREKMSSNVGSNRREAVLLAEAFERNEFEVRRVTPTRTKWTAADLKRITGITNRTNQHCRDAIALVYGL